VTGVAINLETSIEDRVTVAADICHKKKKPRH